MDLYSIGMGTPGNPPVVRREHYVSELSRIRFKEEMIGLDGYNPVSTIKPKTKVLESKAVQVLDLS